MARARKPAKVVLPNPVPGVVVTTAKTVRGRWHAKGRKPGAMNAMEAAYARVLELRRISPWSDSSPPDVVRWDFEPEKLRLADMTYYVPDFRVLLLDGSIEFHEVKGFMEPTGRVKIKVAAELHPYRFFQVTRVAKKDGGGWSIIEVK